MIIITSLIADLYKTANKADKIEGKWNLSGKQIILFLNSEDSVGFTNQALQIQRGKLLQPLHREPTHRFIMYKNKSKHLISELYLCI